MTNAQRSTSANNAISPAAAAWRIAVNEFEAVSAQFEQNWAAYEAADEAAKRECPSRLREYQRTYGISPSMPRDVAIEAVDRYIERRDFPNGIDENITDEYVDAVAIEASRIVDEYTAHATELTDCAERHRVNELWKAHCAFVSAVYDPAREKLFATPAPDVAAVLFKAEVLAGMIDEAEGLRDDLQRLFGDK
jgi:hypothetical protein